ncbi:MAG: polymer-forming cytoskeletal protein [Defluviitaleaceae bacterium]|nr:polymer-forming cytoskeletal protein [Defluviitaleaceae bacterium]
MAFGKKKDAEVVLAGASVIEPGIEIYGEKIVGSTSIIIRGIVKSVFEIDAEIVVDHEGYIEGDIYCRNCTVKGKVVGNVSASGHLHITDEGSIIGDVSCGSLEVSSGGNFVGSCNQAKAPTVVRRELLSNDEVHSNVANLNIVE